MKARLLQLADTLRHSYWFLPAVMALTAVLMAGGAIVFDTWAGAGWMDSVPWLYATHPGGARLLLSAIGGSMITVAGTVFSVTIAAVVYASGQYGPRLLSNFMSDRGNQVTLGTFIATYIYCLVVLRTIRSPDEGGGIGFVPNVALLGAVVLALCSIAVLIFFIHHVPSRIHINSVIEDVGRQLLADIEERFPEFIGEAPGDTDAPTPELPAVFAEDAGTPAGAPLERVESAETGYIQLIDEAALLAVARQHDLVLRLLYQPGDFVHAGRVLLEAWPAGQCGEDCARKLGEAFAINARRSPLQDLRFLFDELVEIAARALSPGVNDPFTAVSCLDWMGAAVSNLARRAVPSHLRTDEDGALRVIAHPVSFESLVDRSFGALAQYCASDMVAADGYLQTLGEVSLDCRDRARREHLARYVDRLDELADTALDGFNRSRVRERAREVRRVMTEPGYTRRLRDGASWLGGTA